MNQQPDRVNFFVTNPVHGNDEGNLKSQQMFHSIMAGRWQLPQDFWVFMLCTALNVLRCQGGVANQPFQLVRVKDEHVVGGQAQTTTTSELTLVRWMHRISTPDISDAKKSAVNLSTHVDPLAKLWGCDRLVWAQKGENEEPAGYQALWKQVSLALKAVGGSIGSGGNSAPAATKARAVKDAKLAQVEAARKKLNQFLPHRLRAADALAGHAYCAIQTTSVSATPVAVMPAFGTCSDTPVWIPKYATDCRTGRLAKYGKSQGHLLSKYTHLRLNLL